MAKIYITYADGDAPSGKYISDRLADLGHDILFDKKDSKAGDNIVGRISENIKKADIVVAILSRRSAQSKFIMSEYTIIYASTISDDQKLIIPVLIDETSVPSFFSRFSIVDMSGDVQAGMQALLNSVELFSGRTRQQRRSSSPEAKPRTPTDHKKHVNNLRRALSSGQLTLVCGAGISIDAGVPDWSNLLLGLLEKVLEKISENGSIKLGKIDPAELSSRYSTLIMAKYLKLNLGKDFYKNVRDALYERVPETGKIIQSVVQLARPQRGRNSLDSIITFNFDDLLERNLKAENVNHRSVSGEGVRPSSEELPIYHVHGYLPRNGALNEKDVIVFSEDAYHTQFIDPFSWSNLVQLNKLSSNSCLFVGISLSDPNLRRLLDVANRKNEGGVLSHYLIKKVPVDTDNKVRDELAYILEEQDASGLGLNMIWVEDYSDIPKVIDQIAASDVGLAIA